jgi:NAD(P)-dependent dehydrogenase (short-subunit alcohol dehydrogenase family)
MKARKRKFEGKIIVITGASSGIGRQAALDFVNALEQSKSAFF